MSNLEPSDVGPLVGGDRAVSESDRQHVITLLTAAHAEGRLNGAERDRRTDEAHQALTFDDLVPLTRDLVAATPQQVSISESGTASETDQIVAIFAGAERRGHWRVRPRIAATAIFGGIELDLTEATFDSRQVSIEVFCLFGGVELKVPNGSEVDNQMGAVFGGCDHKVGPPQPGAPKVLVRGFSVFGGVEIRNPKANKRPKRNRS